MNTFSPTRNKKKYFLPPKKGQTGLRAALISTAHPQMALGGLGQPRKGSSWDPQPLPARHTHPGGTVTGWVGRWWHVVVTRTRRRPRALKVAAAGSGQRRRGGVLRVTRVTTTWIRGVGRGPITSARTIRHSGLVVEHEFYEKLKKTHN